MAKYIVCVLVLSTSLFAKAKETVLETDVYVGDTIHYQIELTEINESNLDMEEGEIYEDDTMPSYKVFDLVKRKNKNKSIYRFL